jgi:hypothetical protein
MLFLVDIASPLAGNPASWLEIIGEGRVKNQPEALIEAEPIPARGNISERRASNSVPTARHGHPRPFADLRRRR